MTTKNLVNAIPANASTKNDTDVNIDEINVALTKPELTLLYFTDPICSACWALEPMIKKLREEYGQYFTFELRMGGMLDNWSNSEDPLNEFSKPEDVAIHWEEVAQQTGMPIDGDIWLEDPLDSSFPASIAFKAAELQDPSLAEQYLRRIREMVFVEKKNIAKKEHLMQAAEDVGLDVEPFSEAFDAPATERLFRQEMRATADINVRGFPTIVLHNSSGQALMVRGIQPYAQYVTAMEQLTGATLEPRNIETSAEEIVEKYGFVASVEVAELLGGERDIALAELEKLAKAGKIEKVPVKNGEFWRSV